MTAPLMEVIRSENWEIIHLVLDHGAEFNATLSYTPKSPYKDKPSTPLFLAIKKRSQSIVLEVIAVGARIDDRDTEGFSLLHLEATAMNSDTGKEKKNGTDRLGARIYQYYAKIK
ncbi:hypothetical protein GGR58DRAFT_506012 [Xylaria digitata]|nr:hypothetical protein GGR58DRAFT_506012 [Xylaria digitata]